MKKIGAITVGQAPRVDVTPDIEPLLRGITLVQRDALDGMTKEDFDPLAFTTAVNTLAVAIAQNLSEDELALLTAVLVQLTGTLTTITVQQTLYGKQKDGQTS